MSCSSMDPTEDGEEMMMRRMMFLQDEPLVRGRPDSACPGVDGFRPRLRARHPPSAQPSASRSSGSSTSDEGCNCRESAPPVTGCPGDTLSDALPEVPGSVQGTDVRSGKRVSGHPGPRGGCKRSGGRPQTRAGPTAPPTSPGVPAWAGEDSLPRPHPSSQHPGPWPETHSVPGMDAGRRRRRLLLLLLRRRGCLDRTSDSHGLPRVMVGVDSAPGQRSKDRRAGVHRNCSTVVRP